MKVKLCEIVLVTGLGIGAQAVAQIPVTDAAAITSAQTAHTEAIAKYIAQIEQLKLQLEQLKQQYSAQTGSRGLGTILNDPKLRAYLPNDWKEVYDKIREGGRSGLSGPAREIADANRVYDTCANLSNEGRVVCEARIAKNAQDKSLTLQAYQKSEERLNQIEALSRQINLTEDPKGIAELNGRIATESAALQNEQIKLELWAKASEAEDKLQEERKQEAFMKELAKPAGVKMTPIDWGTGK